MSTVYTLSPESFEREKNRHDVFLADHKGKPSNWRQALYAKTLIKDGNLDGLAYLLQEKGPLQVNFESVLHCPFDKRETLIRMMLETGLNVGGSDKSHDFLCGLHGDLFKLMITQGIDLATAVHEAAGECSRDSLTHIIAEAWDIGLVTEHLLKDAVDAWGTLDGPAPPILDSKRRALIRMEKIKEMGGSQRENPAVHKQAMADFALDRAVSNNDSDGVLTAMMHGAALDGEVTAYAPIRRAAELGHVSAFMILLGFVEKPYDETLPNVAHAVGARGMPEMAKVLVNLVGTPDFDDGAMLRYAVLHPKNRAFVRFLLDIGANPAVNGGEAIVLAGEVALRDSTDMAVVDMLRSAAAEQAAATWAARLAEAAEDSADAEAHQDPPGRRRRPG